MSEKNDSSMVEVLLGRIVIRDGDDRQHIYLTEKGGGRGFPIVIGTAEAAEIQRVVAGIQLERPLTHQLCLSAIEALDAEVVRTDITKLENNTFYAQLVLHSKRDETTAVLDARPSDAIALTLRAGGRLRVAEAVLEQVRTDTSGPDPLPPPEADEPQEPESPPDDPE